VSDEQIDAIADTMPHQPWGIGSRRQDMRAFARALLALATPKGEPQPVFHLRSYGDVSEAELERLAATPKEAQPLVPDAAPAVAGEVPPDHLGHSAVGDRTVPAAASEVSDLEASAAPTEQETPSRQSGGRE
jgi:hypothetical protein